MRIVKLKFYVEIIGEFLQSPADHLKAHGCPKCKSIISKGEIQVSNYIQQIYKGNISLNDRKTVKNPNTDRYLELDIYLPDKKIAIEYNGKHWHEKPDVIIKDNIKKEFCRDNGIYLMIVDDYKWQKDDNYKKLIKHILKFKIKTH